MGHSGSVNSVAISPDGKTALSGGDDATLKLWDLTTGREIREFKGHSEQVNSVAISPDGKTALSGSNDYTMKLWEVATGRELKSFTGHTYPIASVVFSADGRLALSGSRDQTLKLWDLATGREIRAFEGHSNVVNTVAISPDGKTALSGSEDKTLKLWDLATGREIRAFKGHSFTVTSVAISPDGKTALSGSGDKTLKLWDLAAGRELKSFEGHTGDVSSGAFSPDGRLVLSGSWDKTLKLWEVASGRELRSFTGHAGEVTSVAFSPDGTLALSGSWGQALTLWELSSGREIREFKGHSLPVTSVAISPDGRLALSGSEDHTLKLWEVASGRKLRSFTGHTGWVHSVAFSPDGRLALSGGSIGNSPYGAELKLWEVASGRELRSFSGHARWVNSVAFSPDGTLALTGSEDKTLKLWDIASGHELKSFEGHTEAIESVAFSPDGCFLLSGSDDRTLKLWEVKTGKELRSFTGHTGEVRSVAFSPDGRFALSGALWDSTLRLWELATGKELRSFTGHTSVLYSVAFSPDGRFALSGSFDHTMKLWEVATGKELRSFSGHTAKVTSVAFSPGGRFVLSGSDDGTTRIWEAGTGQELARLMAGPDGEWLTFTRNGFFSSSNRDTAMLAIVRGIESTTIGQVHQSLFNPDLVREALAGDPDGEVKRAAEVINLEKVLDAGPPPIVTITSQEPGSRSRTDLLTVVARIKDRGRGIGRIEWRINGVTAGVRSAPAGAGPDYEVTQELALDPGENRIEVIAYEDRNLLASLPAQTTIVYTGPADSVKPKLYVLAIGINAYDDYGWAPLGADHIEKFPPLEQSVSDAKALASELRKAAAPLYGDRVEVTEALDKDATAEGLDKIVGRIAGRISPRDTFVFYAAGHGYSLNGRYYLIPQDYQGGSNPEALAAKAIGQEKLQDWIANRIKAKKAIILLDTCRSGALTQGYSRPRVGDTASEAAIGRLHEATGRPVLTAAAAAQDAQEITVKATGQGYGLFTAALIDALHHARADAKGQIWVSDLAAHVQDLVPKLASGAEVRLAIPRGTRGGEGQAADFEAQSAHFGTTGSDFALVARLP